MTTIEDKMRALPSDAQQEVEDFIEFLLVKRGSEKAGSTKPPQNRRQVPAFKWAGALSGMGKHYTAVHLQHEILAQRAAGSLNDGSAQPGSVAGR